MYVHKRTFTLSQQMYRIFPLSSQFLSSSPIFFYPHHPSFISSSIFPTDNAKPCKWFLYVNTEDLEFPETPTPKLVLD